MKKLSIIIIGSAWPFRGGLAAYNERLATEFLTSGNDVSVETFKLQYPKILFPGKTQFADWEAPEHLEIHRSVNSINPFNWLKVGRRIRKKKPDLVVIKYWIPFMGPCFGTIARQIKKNGHTQVITILDNIIPHENRPGDRAFTRYFIKPLDGFVAMSDSVLSDINSFDRLKPRALCPHPLYDNFGEKVPKTEARKELGLDPDLKYILFFGFIREYKGLDLLLEAFSDSRFERSDIRLLVAGEFYTDPEPYIKLIREQMLEERVILRNDFIPDRDVRYYFSAADLVVQPYRSATQSGISQIAYHFEKPMIVTDVGGLPEIVPDGKVGFVVERDPGKIASAIFDFYDKGLEEDFAKNAAKEKLKYSWNNMVETIISLTKYKETYDNQK